MTFLSPGTGSMTARLPINQTAIALNLLANCDLDQSVLGIAVQLNENFRMMNDQRQLYPIL